jgi:hypothetical protein
MAWDPFQWGSRGPWYHTPEDGIYVAHIFINNGIRAVLRCTGPGGQEFLHTFHARGPNSHPDFTDCQTVAQVVAAWWNASYRNMTTGGVVGRDVVATGIDTVPASQATVVGLLAGTRLGEILPSEVSCSVKYFTHLSGHTNYGGGRAFPATELDITGDHFSPAYITAIGGVFQNLINAFNAAGYPQVIASRHDIALKVIAGVAVLDDVADSQRRRTINRGR